MFFNLDNVLLKLTHFVLSKYFLEFELEFLETLTHYNVK